MLDKLWSRFVLQLNQSNPFFACLALFTRLVPDDRTDIASTGGKEIRINPDFLLNQPDAKAFSYLLHQVLHLALQHAQRRHGRDEQVWNIAADIVVNHTITSTTKWPTAPMTAWDNRFADLCVEQVYSQLYREQSQIAVTGPVQSDDAPAGSAAGPALAKLYGAHADLDERHSQSDGGDQLDDDSYWRDALSQAESVAHSREQADLPAGLKREFERVARSRVDWRRELWRFVSDRQSDFSEYDRRHIHRGVYLEELRVDGLQLAVAIDTSGSIDERELGTFIRELEAIQKLHQEVSVQLYYCDAIARGPYALKRATSHTPPPLGGGGTSFEPVFNAIDALALNDRPDCLIYFTDGYGEFPARAPAYATLWLLCSAGCDESDVPFGATVRVPDGQ